MSKIQNLFSALFSCLLWRMNCLQSYEAMGRSDQLGHDETCNSHVRGGALTPALTLGLSADSERGVKPVL